MNRPTGICSLRLALGLYILSIAVATAGCSKGDESKVTDVTAGQVIELPGTRGEVDFDDIVYSAGLRSILVPARENGLYLIETTSGKVRRIQYPGSVDSVDEGEGLLFLLDRSEQTITVVNPKDGRPLSSVLTSASPDYVRYVPTGELWVTEPNGSPPGIEIFVLDEDPSQPPQPSDFVAVTDGAEGLSLSTARQAGYTHAGSDLVGIRFESHTVTERWPTGCEGTHGFPRIDEGGRLALASCADDGEVRLLDLDNGMQLGRHEAGGGESLPAYSSSSGHFYARGDPGTTLVTLEPSSQGLVRVNEVTVPRVGHCLTADDLGHYWTCDAEGGRILRFDDQ